MGNERLRNRDGRDGDVLVNDSVASGRPDLPIHDAPVRDTSIAIDADELGEGRTRSGQAQAQDESSKGKDGSK